MKQHANRAVGGKRSLVNGGSHADASTPPHSVDAEQAVLGALMLDPAAWPAIADSLACEDFYRSNHRLIFDAAVSVIQAGHAIDVVTVSEHLQRIGRLDDSGGLAYVGKLARDTPSAANVRAYADIVRDRAQLRRLQEVASEIAAAASNAREGARDLLLKAEQEVAKLRVVQEGRATDREALTWYAAAAPVLGQAFVVKDLILAGSLALVFGESNSGKTFFVLDLALAVASGEPWRGMHVQKGLVLYVAGEGAHSVRNRIIAYRCRRANGHASNLPFAVLGRAVNLLDPAADLDALISLVRVAESECGEKCALIIVDTLARAMPGGDENSAEDMGAFIANTDRLRAKTGAAVVLVHHSGKDSSRGARGHSSLRAAVDTEIAVEGQSGTRTATVMKQRDLPTGARFAFDLERVVIGTDPHDGQDVTSCVVEPAEAQSPRRRDPTGKNQQLLLGAIREHVRTRASTTISSIDLIAMAKAQGIRRNRLSEARDGLQRDRWIMPAVGGYTFLEEPT